MITELLDQKKEIIPGRWVPCPPVTERSSWDCLPGKKRWIKAGRESLRSDRSDLIPPLPLSLWEEFTEKGNRTHYEKPYFARRRNLCRLVMAECFDNKGTFLPAIADSVWAICEESAWNLPAHNSYIRDTPVKPLPDTSHPVVDLFAAETGALISMTVYLLGPQLETVSPGITVRMSRETDRRIIKPYLHTHFWWMGNGNEPMNNWTVWCTQNVLICVSLLHPDDRSIISPAVRQASASLDCFLKDYGADGCCSEGAQYYGHAGLCLFNALEILCALMPGVFESVWKKKKIRNIAEYIFHVHVGGPYYLNFSDCSPVAGCRGARDFLFGRRVGSTDLPALAVSDFLKDTDPDHLKYQDDSEGINLFYHIQTAFAEPEIRRQLTIRQQEPACSPGSHFFRDSGLFCRRSGAYFIGIKAGNNADSHNHNDTGSVTLYKDNRPVLIDVGVESYTQKTFSAHRYEIWTMQSSWHNLPEFDPEENRYQQLPGKEYRAADVKAGPGPDHIRMDIAPAYNAHGEVPGLGFYRREFTVLPSRGLVISDETDYPGQVALSLMSSLKPTVKAKLISLGSLASVHITGPCEIRTETVKITDPRLRVSWPQHLYRTRIYFKHHIRLKIV